MGLQAQLLSQKNSRRLWRSQRRKSRSAPEGGAGFPAAIFLAGKCPNHGRGSMSCCRKIGKFFQQRRNLPENFSSKEFLTATAFSSSLIILITDTASLFFGLTSVRLKERIPLGDFNVVLQLQFPDLSAPAQGQQHSNRHLKQPLR